MHSTAGAVAVIWLEHSPAKVVVYSHRSPWCWEVLLERSIGQQGPVACNRPLGVARSDLLKMQWHVLVSDGVEHAIRYPEA